MAMTHPKPAAFLSELPEDLHWLAHDFGTSYTLPSCHLILRPLREKNETHQRDIAEQRHSMGTTLIDLIKHGAVATLGCETLAEFLEKHAGIPYADGLEYIRFAKGATAEQATTYKYSRCVEAIKLAPLAKRRDLRDLAEKPIDVPLEDGTTESLAFTPTTPVSKLRWAVERFKAAPAAPKEETPLQTSKRRLRQLKNLVAEIREEFPSMKKAKLRVKLYAGHAQVKHDTLTEPEQFEAAIKLYQGILNIP